MIYKENINLFNLENINWIALQEKISDSKKSIDIDVSIIKEFLILFKNESIVVNKNDFDVNVALKVSASKNPDLTIELSSQQKLLPHIFYNNFTFKSIEYLSSFNTVSPMHLFDSILNGGIYKIENKVCTHISSNILNALFKVDELFNYNNELYSKVYNHGLYLEAHSIIHEDFEVNFRTTECKCSSVLKNKNKHNKYSLFIIDIQHNLSGVEIWMPSFTIKLTYDEFMKMSIKDFETTLISNLKLKNINIHSIDDFKNYLRLKEMENF